MTEGVKRVDLTGHLPHLERRRDLSHPDATSKYFVCFEDLGVELVMAFEEGLTARELAVNIYHGTPFFTAIPVVPYRTPYPRRWLVYPDLSDTWRRIEVRNS
jgi:hypothetical protein